MRSDTTGPANASKPAPSSVTTRPPRIPDPYRRTTGWTPSRRRAANTGAPSRRAGQAGLPVACYGLPGYLQIIDTLTATGWPRHAFWPHGGHLFSLHLVAALGLGGAEINPLAFHPFHGPPPAVPVNAGRFAVVGAAV